MTAPLTDTQVAWLLAELGTDADVANLNARFADLESVRDVAIQVLRERRAVLLESPLSVTLSGVASISSSENVKALERRILELTRLDDDPSDDEVPDGGAGRVAVIPLVRTRGR